MFTPNQSLSVALLPKNFIDNTNILFLPHPRNGSQSPFIIIQGKMYEILEVSIDSPSNTSTKSNSKSFFVGNNVVSNGNLLFVSEIHPIIVVLPFLMKRKKEFYSQDNYFTDTPYESISNYIYPYFDEFGDFENLEGQNFWSFDDSKMLSFLKNKFDRLSDYFTIYNDNIQRIREKSLDALKHYVPSKYIETFKCYLTEKDPEMFPQIIFGNPYFLQKMVDKSNDDQKKKEKNKSFKFTYKRKKIPKYLINNREITSFFKPQKIVA